MSKFIYILFFINILNNGLMSLNNLKNYSHNQNQYKNFSNYYIPIHYNVLYYDNIDYQDQYFIFIIEYLFNIINIVNIILKYESNNDNKIQLQKYISLLDETLIIFFHYRYICEYKQLFLNNKIYNYLKLKIFPLLKKINYFIKHTYNKLPIKSMFDIKKYIYNNILKIRPKNLNCYMLNLLLINNYNHLPMQYVVLNYKEFLFYTKALLQAIVETSQNKIIPEDYKKLQSIINQISKIVDKLNKILLSEIFNIDNNIYYREITDILEKINNIFKRTYNISTYKILEKLNSNLYNNDNCLEYIPGYYQNKKKHFYQFLVLRTEYFYLNKYYFNITFEQRNLRIKNILDILKIILEQEPNHPMKNDINNIFNQYNDFLELQLKKKQNINTVVNDKDKIKSIEEYNKKIIFLKQTNDQLNNQIHHLEEQYNRYLIGYHKKNFYLINKFIKNFIMIINNLNIDYSFCINSYKYNYVNKLILEQENTENITKLNENIKENQEEIIKIHTMIEEENNQINLLKNQHKEVMNMLINQEQQLFLSNETAFNHTINLINEVLKNSKLNIENFYGYIYENILLTPIIEGQLNEYYIEYLDFEENLKFLLMLKKHLFANNYNIIDVFIKDINEMLSQINNNKLDNLINNQIINTTKTLYKNNEKFYITHHNIKFNDPLLQEYISFINNQIKKLPVQNKFKLHNIDINNFYAMQKIIEEMKIEDIILYEQQDIILLSYYEFKSIKFIIEKYNIKINLWENQFNKLINLNYEINGILKNFSITVQSFYNFIVPNFYSLNINEKTPLLVKKN